MWTVHKSRIGLFLVGFILLSWMIPQVYDIAVFPSRFYLSGKYSPVFDTFYYRQYYGDDARLFKTGNRSVSEREFREALPFSNTFELRKRNAFPLIINGQSFTFKEAGESQKDFLSPKTVSKPFSRVGVLFESEPDGPGLLIPQDILLVRDNKLLLWTARQGHVNQEATARLNAALSQAGVTFPLRYFTCNPSTFKPFDEGLFLVDKNRDIYQVKQSRGRITVTRELRRAPENLRYLSVQEDDRREYYGIAVTDTAIYLNRYDVGLTPLAANHYRSDRDYLVLQATPMNKTLSLRSTQDVFNSPGLRVSAYDTQNRLLALDAVAYPQAMLSDLYWMTLVKDALAPCRLKIFSPDRWNAKPTFVITDHLSLMFWLNGLLAVIYGVIGYWLLGRRTNTLYRRQYYVYEQLPGFVLIVVLGLPAMIALWISGSLITKLPNDPGRFDE